MHGTAICMGFQPCIPFKCIQERLCWAVPNQNGLRLLCCLHYINGNRPLCSLCVCIFGVYEVFEIIPPLELLTYFQWCRAAQAACWQGHAAGTPTQVILSAMLVNQHGDCLQCIYVFVHQTQALLLTSALKVAPNRDVFVFPSSVLLLEVDLGVNILGVFRVELRFLIAKRVQSGF